MIKEILGIISSILFVLCIGYLIVVVVESDDHYIKIDNVTEPECIMQCRHIAKEQFCFQTQSSMSNLNACDCFTFDCFNMTQPYNEFKERWKI
jgi:hypothetical protein